MELCELSDETKELLLYVFEIELKWSKTKPGDWILPSSINLKKIKEFEIYEDNIWIITTPKSEKTWMQELAWFIMHDVDIGKSKCDQFFRCPFLELEHVTSLNHIRQQKKLQKSLHHILMFLVTLNQQTGT